MSRERLHTELPVSTVPNSGEDGGTEYCHFSFLVFDSSCSKVGLDGLFEVKIGMFWYGLYLDLELQSKRGKAEVIFRSLSTCLSLSSHL
jgi:hypothetical protein